MSVELKKRCLIIVSLLFLSSALSAKPFSVMVYNVQNLFDLTTNGLEYPEFVPNTHNWNAKTAEKKYKNIASVISRINPDISILCEVENSNATNILCDFLFKKGLYYRKENRITGEIPNPSNISVVVLSKFPIIQKELTGIPKKGRYFTRNIVRTDVKIGSDTLTIFAIHLPSKGHKESSRIFVANYVKKQIEKLPKNRDYIIAGDLNENYNESEIFDTENLNNTNGKTAINHIFKTVVSAPNDFINFVSPKFALENKLKNYCYNPWLEKQDLFSYIFKGRKETIDNIILSGKLFDNKGVSYIYNSFTPFTYGGKLLRSGKPYAWQISRSSNGKYHTGYGFSDHLPVIAKFTTGKYCGPLPEMTQSNSRQLGEISSFETGFDGWLSCSGNYKLNRLTYAKNTVLGMSGLSYKNTCVALCKVYNPKHFKKLSFAIKGSGSFIFSVQSGENKFFFNGYNFQKVSKSAHYEPVKFQNETKITLSIPDKISTCKSFLLSLRSARSYPLNISIDNVQIK